MKKYQVKDYGSKICSGEISRNEIAAMLITFIGLFGAERENIKIRNCETNAEMTLDEFRREEHKA